MPSVPNQRDPWVHEEARPGWEGEDRSIPSLPTVGVGVSWLSPTFPKRTEAVDNADTQTEEGRAWAGSKGNSAWI